ncbi:MAG: helix-turn-helix domain-containing protein [Euzebyaceae bacterium]|jgi:excisionase family DNA binding protein|nr:helix-turn-helix domain-containing protein [Euzebyaceae bacterium]
MGTVQEATLTLGEAARRLGISVETLLRLIYDGKLAATPEPASGRLLVSSKDLEGIRQP